MLYNNIDLRTLIIRFSVVRTNKIYKQKFAS